VPGWLVRAGYWFVKKPDLVLLLDASAEALQSRKQEVPFAETQRQCEAYRNLFRTLPNGKIISAGSSPEKVAFDATATILEFMQHRVNKRFGAEAARPSRRTDHAVHLSQG